MVLHAKPGKHFVANMRDEPNKPKEDDMQKITWFTIPAIPCMVCHEGPMEFRTTIPHACGTITISICAECARLTPSELLTILES